MRPVWRAATTATAPTSSFCRKSPSTRTSSSPRWTSCSGCKSNVIIAASEGVKTADGTYLCDLVSTAGQLDAFGHKAILSGTSRYLSDLIHDKLNCKSRAIEFSTLQRCASHLASRTDVNEAYAVGGAAAAAAFAGETGKMIALKRVSELSLPVHHRGSGRAAGGKP